MTMETKQLHALSKIYKEAVYGGAKKEAPKDTRMVVTAADKKANTKAYQNLKAGVKGYKAADHLKNEEFVDEGALVKAAQGAEKVGGAIVKGGKAVVKGVRRANRAIDKADRAVTKATMNRVVKPVAKAAGKAAVSTAKAAGRAVVGGVKGAVKGALNKEGFSNWRQDLKEIPDYDQIPVDSKKSGEKISEKKVKNTIKINPEMKEEKRWQDDDGDGKWYEKSDVDGKISKREKKSKKHNCASKVKHEEFGIGDCISEAHDLDENGNVAHYDVEFEEYIVKGIPVEELEILEGSIHEHVIHEQKKSYETTKRKEVLAALKRDKRPLDKKTKEKIAAKIVKDKGDTSKSDDRYAYESKLWDEVAENLTELGELGGVKYKVVPLDESDIADILARLEKKRIRQGGDPDKSPLGKKTGRAMKSQQDKARKKAGLE